MQALDKEFSGTRQVPALFSALGIQHWKNIGYKTPALLELTISGEEEQTFNKINR